MTDNLELNVHHFENDGFATANGMRLVELRPGFAKTCLAVEQRHMNNVGMVHGGAIFTLAAFAFGAASRTAGQATVGVSTNISFLKPTRSGTLWAVKITGTSPPVSSPARRTAATTRSQKASINAG